jgi:hypothetical protein
MLTSIEQITQLLPQASESVLAEIWMILNAATSRGESSAVETTVVRNHSAFLNCYALEDEGLYDDD